MWWVTCYFLPTCFGHNTIFIRPPDDGQSDDENMLVKNMSFSIFINVHLLVCYTSKLYFKSLAPVFNWGKCKFQPITCHEGTEGEYRYSSTLSLPSKLDGVSGQSHSPAALPPRKRTGTHCIGGWVGPRAGLGGYVKSRPPTGIRSSDRTAYSELLYRLSCTST